MLEYSKPTHMLEYSPWTRVCSWEHWACQIHLFFGGHSRALVLRVSCCWECCAAESVALLLYGVLGARLTSRMSNWLKAWKYLKGKEKFQGFELLSSEWEIRTQMGISKSAWPYRTKWLTHYHRQCSADVEYLYVRLIKSYKIMQNGSRPCGIS